jgi:hypothetical protein
MAPPQALLAKEGQALQRHARTLHERRRLPRLRRRRKVQERPQFDVQAECSPERTRAPFAIRRPRAPRIHGPRKGRARRRSRLCTRYNANGAGSTRCWWWNRHRRTANPADEQQLGQRTAQLLARTEPTRMGAWPRANELLWNGDAGSADVPGIPPAAGPSRESVECA